MKNYYFSVIVLDPAYKKKYGSYPKLNFHLEANSVISALIKLEEIWLAEKEEDIIISDIKICQKSKEEAAEEQKRKGFIDWFKSVPPEKADKFYQEWEKEKEATRKKVKELRKKGEKILAEIRKD